MFRSFTLVGVATVCALTLGVVTATSFALLCRSFGSQAIAVHRASVPVASQVHELQSSLNARLGVHVNPGSVTGIFTLEGHPFLVQAQSIPFETHRHRLQSLNVNNKHLQSRHNPQNLLTNAPHLHSCFIGSANLGRGCLFDRVRMLWAIVTCHLSACINSCTGAMTNVAIALYYVAFLTHNIGSVYKRELKLINVERPRVMFVISGCEGYRETTFNPTRSFCLTS